MTKDLLLKPVTVKNLCDNESACKVGKDPISSDRTKHIEIKHRKIQELVEHGKAEVVSVRTDKQLADPLTKVLDEAAFLRHREAMGVMPVI